MTICWIKNKNEKFIYRDKFICNLNLKQIKSIYIKKFLGMVYLNFHKILMFNVFQSFNQYFNQHYDKKQ